ncbi:alpha/beta hydrolase [Halobacterium rubrum]|uniref:alpha/beta hydrolase n=1 Tax=Halobacterium TaxID=2239 RepID=UPI001F1F62B8|nr:MULTISPECIES: alpha/beta hydrolase [Halobacterium]MDH5019814.1 alpha/beta hydrolase [Halobacterium rubrum]
MADEPRADVQGVLEAIEAMDAPAYHELSPPEAREMRRGLLDVPAESEALGREYDRTIPGPGHELPVRVYEPDGDGPHPVVVYFHGGGFVLGTLDSRDPICRTVAREAEAVVVSVAYRLAPEHPFPAAVEDAYAATQWVAEHAGELGADPDRLAVAGDSAGGNLAAAVALAARDRSGGPDVAHQGLVYPVLDHREHTDHASHEENAEGYFLEDAGMTWFDGHYVDSWVHRQNPALSPLAAASHADLPPASVVTCGFDPLRDEGIAYVDALEAAGVDVQHRHYDDLVHGVMSMVVDPLDIPSGHEVLDAFASDLGAALHESS